MGVDLFLKLTKGGAPIKGECQDAPFQGMIQLRSMQMASLSLLPQRGGGPVRPEAAAAGEDACSFTVKKLLDSSSMDLFLNYTDAQSPERREACLLRATVYLRADGASGSGGPEAVSFLTLDFFDVFVYDYSLEGNQDDPRPVEEVKLYFDKYRMTYREPLGPDGASLRPPRAVDWDFTKPEPK